MLLLIPGIHSVEMSGMTRYRSTFNVTPIHEVLEIAMKNTGRKIAGLMLCIVLLAVAAQQATGVLFYRSTVPWETGGISGRRAVPVSITVDMDEGSLQVHCGAPQQSWCWKVNGRYVFYYGNGEGTGGTTTDSLSGHIDSVGTIE